MPLSAITAGFIAILVGYSSSAAIIFQAAQAAGASPGEIASWMGALGIGLGITTLGLSLKYRSPVITAWSTPGAALLVSALAGVGFSEAVGAFMVTGVLLAIVGFSGWFEWVMKKMPMQLAAAMLAGVLAKFGMDVFLSMQDALYVVLPMFIAYLALKNHTPRGVVIIVLVIGVALAWGFGMIDSDAISLEVTRPVITLPTFTLPAVVSISIPLFLVTMASQNIPGVAALRTHGYDNVPVSPVIGVTGIMSLLIAPFGAHSINLAAITASICMGPAAHPDKDKRYLAGVATGIVYLLAGVFGASIAALFLAFPKALVLSIGGIALLGTITNSLQIAMSAPDWREPALITFLVTLSGVTLFGIGSAFWGIVAGGIAMLLLGRSR